MSAVRQRTLCLCCGTYYDADEECPNVNDKRHDLMLALAVSRYLFDIGITRPDKHDVREALGELGYR